MLIFFFLTLTSHFTLIMPHVHTTYGYAPTQGAYRVHMEGGPLKGHLLCSGCEVIVRELLSENKKQYRANDRYLGELEFTELQERVCRAAITHGIGKYMLAQENSGGHFKIFVEEGNKDDMQRSEPPTFYGDGQDYIGATGRLESMCTEYMGDFEDDIKKLLDDRASEKQFRDRICIRLAKVCHRDVLEPYDKVEKEKRKMWMGEVWMKRRDSAQSEIGQSLAEELEHDETAEGKERAASIEGDKDDEEKKRQEGKLLDDDEAPTPPPTGGQRKEEGLEDSNTLDLEMTSRPLKISDLSYFIPGNIDEE